MLEIPAGLTFSIILLTITTFLCFLFAIALSSHPRMQRSATLIGIVILLWIIFQSTLSLNRWYMDRKTVHLLFPYLTTFTLSMAIGFLPIFKDFRAALQRPTLLWMQILRLPLYGLLYWSSLHKQSPAMLWLYPFVADLIILLLLPVVWQKTRKEGSNGKLERAWHLAGFLSLMTGWIMLLLSAPSSLQRLAFQSPNYLIVHFPGSWIPSVIIPLLMFGHVSQLLHAKH